MKKPVFVVLRRYFSSIRGVNTPFAPASADVTIFESFEEAKGSVLRWAESMGKENFVFCDWGELPRAASQCDDLVFSISVSSCVSQNFVTVAADIYQKYVL